MTTFRYPIGLLLALLVAVPFVGAGWFAVDYTRNASAQRAQTDMIDASVRRLILLTELRARLLDERNWSAALGGIEEIGLETSFTLALTGLDVPFEAEQAMAEVDRLLIEVGRSDVTAEVDRVRGLDGFSLAAISGEYDDVEAQLADEADRTLDELLERAGTLDGADRLVTALRVVRASTDARQAISNEFTASFSAQFSPITGGSTELSTAVEQRAIRAEAEREIRRLAVDGSNVHGSIETISTSPAAALFDSSVADLLEEQLGAQTGAGADLSAVLDDLDSVASVFAASSDTTSLYFDLVDAAGLDTLEASEALAERADRQQTRAMVSMVSLALMSLGTGFAATRVIRQPVRRLANVASRLSGGDSAARFADASGPVEIRAAGNALDAAAEHLQLAERQAKALADGELDHPVLSHENAGELGASLQHAVGALATSLQEREEFRRRMTHEATHDGLTGIANRKASLAQLNRALARTHRSGTSLAVLFIDLDGFKAVNDTHGHRAGDTVLRTIAHRMVNAVRAGDHVGRIGGDEFVVIAEPVDDIQDAIELAKRLLDELAAPIQCDAARLAVSASIGISMSDDIAQPAATPEDGTELLRDADLAVYKAKSAGRGRIELCDDDLRASVFEQADLEKALRNAIVENEFVLHYQPIIKPPEGTLHGLEALIRWSRPSKGMVRPDEFIPFAERSDLIVMIDQWVLGTVARQMVAWDAAGHYEGVPVSINISGRHLASADFVDDVMSPLRDNGVDPTRIIIEITESALLDDLDGAASKLQALRSFGIRVAIDDFGTGYTSLAHLKSLPIDILKIDRSFTNDESSSSLAKLIIDTGHLLGATITAEGIETVDQAASLTAMGSDELQGYLYGRPEPAEGLPKPEDSNI
ncbi:MAG: putative bifunctional diguanylate cyclase/phosphodiesterase [Acidimicrobiales bacterium]